MRVSVSDNPSRLSMHFSGSAPGPSSPFGFDIGHFVVATKDMGFINPAYITARTKVMDYFYEQRKCIKEDHTIFNWEKSMEFHEGERRLLHQICWEMGFDADPNKLPLYLSGEIPM